MESLKIVVTFGPWPPQLDSSKEILTDNVEELPENLVEKKSSTPGLHCSSSGIGVHN